MKAELLISFPDQSQSFSFGVEYGRILQQMKGQILEWNKSKIIKLKEHSK